MLGLYHFYYLLTEEGARDLQKNRMVHVHFRSACTSDTPRENSSPVYPSEARRFGS